ncbi:TPA: 30S ribosomal protein S19e [Candidatus Micrarchaeota archaeon]|nr:30S ribosomal protein S19e [Candidatus Micrarchaeota archaeon]
MVIALDIDANKLIGGVADKLKKMGIEKPAFVGLVKTGSHAERLPDQADFWFIRCASVLRQAYVRNVIGTNRLRRHYGGRKNNGVQPEHNAPAGGSTIRKAMQALEKHGLLVKKNPGRSLSAKGRKLLDSVAKELSG